MATTTTAASTTVTVALDAIDLGDNVRDELDLEHVQHLAASIRLRGLLSPLTVKPTGHGRFQLVAGFHRYAACRLAELAETAAVVRDQAGESADRAAENMLRKPLNPLEEARSVQAMLAQGYTAKGAATILGMTVKLVTARTKLLELPDNAQRLIGTGEIPLSAVEALLTVQQASPKLCALLADAIAEAAAQGDHDWGAQLVRDPGWLIGRVLAHRPGEVWATYLDHTGADDVEQLRLGKTAATLLAQAETLHRKLDRYAYGPPRIAFDDADVDQARAAGVLLELGRRPIILDRSLYRELAKTAIARTVENLQARIADQAEQRQLERTQATAHERTPIEQAEVEHRAQLRELTAQAHGTNLDLGAALLDGLATVDPADMTVARFFAYGLLGPDSQHYLGTGDATARTIAANGLRLVLAEHRTAETPARKDGNPGKTKITYGEIADAQQWLWRFVDGAKTAGELYGRVLCIFAAQHYAHQQVLPQSQRRPSAVPRSKDDKARKALERAAKAVLPGTYKQLHRALDRAAREHHQRLDALRAPTRPHHDHEADAADVDDTATTEAAAEETPGE